MADFMRRNPGWSVFLEEVLDGPRGDMIALLTQKERPLDLVADKPVDLFKRLVVDEYRPYLIAFPLNSYRLLLKVDIFDAHRAEFRNTDTCCVDQADDQPVALALDGVEQADHLAVFEVFQFLILDPGPLHPDHRVGDHDPLHVEIPVERGERRDHPMESFGLVILLLRKIGEEIGDEGRRDIDVRIQRSVLEHSLIERDPVRVLPEPGVPGETPDGLKVFFDRPGRVVPHPEVTAEAIQPFRETGVFHCTIH